MPNKVDFMSQPDLSVADLEGLDLRGTNLCETNFPLDHKLLIFDGGRPGYPNPHLSGTGPSLTEVCWHHDYGNQSWSKLAGQAIHVPALKVANA